MFVSLAFPVPRSANSVGSSGNAGGGFERRGVGWGCFPAPRPPPPTMGGASFNTWDSPSPLPGEAAQEEDAEEQEDAAGHCRRGGRSGEAPRAEKAHPLTPTLSKGLLGRGAPGLCPRPPPLCSVLLPPRRASRRLQGPQPGTVDGKGTSLSLGGSTLSGGAADGPPL